MKTVIFSFLGLCVIVASGFALSEMVRVSTEECNVCHEINLDETQAQKCQSRCTSCKSETKTPRSFANCLCGKLEVTMGEKFVEQYPTSKACIDYYMSVYQE